MYVIRNVFRCKPGKAGDVIGKFKAALPMMQEIAKHRILVDEVATFWTVVVETETDDLAAFEKMLKERAGRQDVMNAMQGYMDGVDSGYREIFRTVE